MTWRESRNVGGSSPRGRGKQIDLDWEDAGPGLIPARAGKTRLSSLSSDLGRAYPRAGGENAASTAALNVSLGSSPRGRGKPRYLGYPRQRERLIPARAGKTAGRHEPRAIVWAHPRAGGENHLAVRLASEMGGSSPRGRGKRQRSRRATRPGRLIPARAGKTRPCSSSTRARRAHPRAGGENLTSAQPSNNRAGSSPRGRGKPSIRRPRASRSRLIPARAGKTVPRRRCPCDTKAHPRAGGENLVVPLVRHSLSGSSPRGRGKPVRVTGKSLLQRAHPRAGGENRHWA